MDEYISKTKFEELMRKKARSNFDLYYADKSKHYHDKAIGYTMAADEAHDFPSEEVQPVNQWISVDDRLPNIGERVFVYIPKPDNHNNIEIAYISEGNDDYPYWVLRDKSQFYSTRFHYISQWMPLPEPPKGSDTEEHTEVSRPNGNCLDCKFQYLEDSDYWCSVCPGNPEDI